MLRRRLRLRRVVAMTGSPTAQKNARPGLPKRGLRPIPVGARIHDLESRLRNISGLIAAMESERVRILTELHFLAKERNA